MGFGRVEEQDQKRPAIYYPLILTSDWWRQYRESQSPSYPPFLLHEGKTTTQYLPIWACLGQLIDQHPSPHSSEVTHEQKITLQPSKEKAYFGTSVQKGEGVLAKSQTFINNQFGPLMDRRGGGQRFKLQNLYWVLVYPYHRKVPYRVVYLAAHQKLVKMDLDWVIICSPPLSNVSEKWSYTPSLLDWSHVAWTAPHAFYWGLD